MYFGHLGQLGISGVIRDHQGLNIKAYSKPIGVGFTIEAEVVVLL